MFFAETSDTSNLTSLSKTSIDNDLYIAKYLPEMEMALRKANSDDLYLLSSEKLKSASIEFSDGIKLSIVAYLNAIRPIAYAYISNDTCGYSLIRQHVNILSIASKKGFRCLKLYKIGISNIYADIPTVRCKFIFQLIFS